MTIEVTILHPDAKARRDDLTARKLCINGETHGAATDGRLCRWCREVHRRGVMVVLDDVAKKRISLAPPPGYKFVPRCDQKWRPATVAPWV